MKYERPSTDDTTGNASSLYGESNHETEGSRDERTLYGEPCHEVGSDRDEQMLYGEPQHESRDESSELPDVDLLFARMRAESVTGPTVLPPRSESRTANTTER